MIWTLLVRLSLVVCLLLMLSMVAHIVLLLTPQHNSGFSFAVSTARFFCPLHHQ